MSARKTQSSYAYTTLHIVLIRKYVMTITRALNILVDIQLCAQGYSSVIPVPGEEVPASADQLLSL